MSEIEDYKPYSLSVEYLENTAPSNLTAPFNLSIEYDENLLANYLLSKVSCSFIAEIIGVNLQPIENSGRLNAFVDCSLISNIKGTQDINNEIGVSLSLLAGFKKALTHLSKNEIPWSKPILRVSNEALFFDKGLLVSSARQFGFNKGLTLSESIYCYFEQCTSLLSDTSFAWRESNKLFKARTLVFENGEAVAIKHVFQHQEMLKRRKTITMSHQVAKQLSKTFTYIWDKGLEIVTQEKLRWEDANQLHYQKHPINPHPEPEIVKYLGTGDLDFNCLCGEVDSHSVVLDFEADDCLPTQPNKKWWYILNNISVTRLDNDEQIIIIDGSYETGRDRWCWIYSLTIPPNQLQKLQPNEDGPLILKIMVNGFEHHMLVEGEPEESHKFAETLYKLNGRSVTALDSETYATKRSFLQENERRAGQLCQAELDRVFSDTVLDWKLLEDTGWVLPTQSLTYTNLAPIDAIKLIVEAGGGFIYSQKASKTLSILPKYKKSFWNSMQFEDYDLILNSGMMLQRDVKKIETDFDYNSMMMINSLSGNTARVGIIDTPKDTPLQTASNPLFTTVSMGGYAKTALSSANVKERHTFDKMIVSRDIGEMLPGKTISFDAEWWGVIDTVKGSFNHKEVWELIEVERISRE